MPKNNTDLDAAMRKFGERVRHGYAVKNPLTDQEKEIGHKAVREQHMEKQKGVHEKSPSPAPEKSRDQNPPDMDRD